MMHSTSTPWLQALSSHDSTSTSGYSSMMAFNPVYPTLNPPPSLSLSATSNQTTNPVLFPQSESVPTSNSSVSGNGSSPFLPSTVNSSMLPQLNTVGAGGYYGFDPDPLSSNPVSSTNPWYPMVSTLDPSLASGVATSIRSSNAGSTHVRPATIYTTSSVTSVSETEMAKGTISEVREFVLWFAVFGTTSSSSIVFAIVDLFHVLCNIFHSVPHMPRHPPHDHIEKLSMNVDTFRSCMKAHLQTAPLSPADWSQTMTTDSFVNMDSRGRPTSPGRLTSDVSSAHLLLPCGVSNGASGGGSGVSAAAGLYDMTDMVGRFDVGAPPLYHHISSDSCSSNSECYYGTPFSTGNNNLIPGFLPPDQFTTYDERFSSASSTWSSPAVLSSLNSAAPPPTPNLLIPVVALIREHATVCSPTMCFSTLSPFRPFPIVFTRVLKIVLVERIVCEFRGTPLSDLYKQSTHERPPHILTSLLRYAQNKSHRIQEKRHNWTHAYPPLGSIIYHRHKYYGPGLSS
ncbi:unnamed protein product [Echinostoma caproni]|uniref:C2H2-type domain-containing protein n=1 Tax=Echinostoma caproni TaxID=27848 RepID=A0A183AMA0_9TREM|nr:unnamed protein product [Echinostoma caproni]